MQRIQYHRYGGPDVMRLEDFQPDKPINSEILIRVRAASVNPLDWKLRQGFMKIVMGGRFPRAMGLDFSGIVDAVGPDVVDVRLGDEVLGTAPMKKSGAFADMLITTSDLVIKKPASLTFSAAAALPSVGVTAWRALVDAGKLSAGQSVFINGAAGGVGQAAIRVALAFGASVTVRVGPSWLDEALKLGVSRVVSYEEALPEDMAGAVDIVFDCHGSLSATEEEVLLSSSGVAIDIDPTFGNLVRSVFSSKHKMVRGMPSRAILQKVVDLAVAGRFPIQIGRSAPLSGAIALIRDLEDGKRVPGKAIIEIA